MLPNIYGFFSGVVHAAPAREEDGYFDDHALAEPNTVQTSRSQVTPAESLQMT